AIRLPTPVTSRYKRPATFGRRWGEATRSERADVGPPRRSRAPARRVGARERAQRMERVVGDQSPPCEIPKGVDGLVRVAAADGIVQRTEERGAALATA